MLCKGVEEDSGEGDKNWLALMLTAWFRDKPVVHVCAFVRF